MPLSPGAAALIARMSPAPDPSRAMLIASTYDRLASRSYWAKLDCLYLLAAHSSQASRLNWKANEFNITVSGSPTFTTDRGWAGALSSYLDTGFAPSTAGRNYALNSATMMGWSITAGAAGIDANFLSVGLFANLGGSATGYLCPRDSTDEIVARVNDPTGMTVSNTASDGMFTAVRDSSTSRGIGHNATMTGGGQVSSSITAGNLILLPGQTVVSNLTMSAAAAGGALTATEVAQLYDDLLPYMRAVTPMDVIGAGAAQFLSEKTFEISSLDSGPISFVEPWGGSEFGHSYTFALSGQPTGVTIDSDTGLLATSSTLAQGAYTFSVVVTNMKTTSKVSTFWITIAVREGVTSSRSGYQILHKDYVVSSGTYGSPTGSDYATVLANIQNTITGTDQPAAGDNNLCATIVFNAGTSYDYSDNRWTFGIQRLKIRSTTAGTQATLRCITSSAFSIAVCSLQLGRGWASDTTATGSYVDDASKDHAYFINTVTAGSTVVTLKTAGDAANFVVGRWVAVASYDQQGGGFPANARYVDYAKLVSKSGATITLDRKLRWTHHDNYWESSDVNSLGKARLIAIDRDTTRMTLRVHMQDILFNLNPNSTSTARMFFYAEALEQYFKNVTVHNFCISQSRHAYLDSCLIGGSELDKLSTRFVMSGGASTLDTTDGISTATGLELVLLKTVSNVSGSILCPRQLRVIGGEMHGDANRPWVVGPWQTWQAWFKGVTFTRVATPTDSAFRVYTPLSFVTIGTEGVTYASGVLTTPTNLGGTNQWTSVRDTAFEGCLVYVGGISSGRNGYITSIARNSTDTAILYGITWLNGAAPGAGDVVYTTVAHEVFVDSTCVAGTNTNFQAIDMVSKETIPGVASRAFPTGYPASTYGF